MHFFDERRNNKLQSIENTPKELLLGLVDKTNRFGAIKTTTKESFIGNVIKF